VYALYATLLLTAALAAFALRKRLLRKDQWNNALFTEQRLTALSLVSKVAFALILIYGLQK
jgi:hypothetical protein